MCYAAASMRSYVVPIAAVALAVFLGYRQWTLERRVVELSRQLGVVSEAAEPPAGTAAAPADSAAVSRTAASHAERLRNVETALSAVRADIRSLEKATADLPPEKAVTDQQILTVMKQQGAKVMETQLKFHRERWLDQREEALGNFSKRFELNPQQSDQLWGLLSSEIDKMVDILRNPESFEDPEQAAAAWKKILLDTDSAAHRVLEPQKAIAWDQTRFLERKFLWPWLPD